MTTHLEHAQLLVTNLERTAGFYLSVFPDWRVRAKGREIGANRYSWIHIGTDDSYVAFRTAYEGKVETPAHVEMHSNHIGIVIDDARATMDRLSKIGAPAKVIDHPYRTRIYTRDPDGYELELVFYATDDSRLRNDYERSVADGTSIVDKG